MNDTKKGLLSVASAVAAFSACVLIAGAGCSSSAVETHDEGDAAAAGDAKTLPKLDAGTDEPDAAHEGFPATHPAAPQVLSVGGPVLATPRFVPIVFSTDTEIANIGKLMKAIGPSSYWKATTSEYGVGAATASDPIVLTEAPPTQLSSEDIVPFLKAHIEDTTSGWGPVDPNAIYAIYYPAGTS
ncbi:MAG: hypothetical protein JWM74_4274, partial [Myxococcaceae bacterium]|nr:hypothetical protein [Myxococcaceae bacterium]